MRDLIEFAASSGLGGVPSPVLPESDPRGPGRQSVFEALSLLSHVRRLLQRANLLLDAFLDARRRLGPDHYLSRRCRTRAGVAFLLARTGLEKLRWLYKGLSPLRLAGG